MSIMPDHAKCCQEQGPSRRSSFKACKALFHVLVDVCQPCCKNAYACRAEVLIPLSSKRQCGTPRSAGVCIGHEFTLWLCEQWLWRHDFAGVEVLAFTAEAINCC
jgi:hypothetical protein